MRARDSRFEGALSATLYGIVDRLRDRTPPLVLDERDRLDGRACLVTGANRGLGLAVARALAGRGARVIAACRSGLDAVARTVNDADARALDLASLASVEALVTGLERDGVVLDVAVLNAGVVASRSRATGDGFDETFQVNFLANVLLVERLLERGRLRRGARLVFVSSESHRSAPPIALDTLGQPRAWGMRQAVAEYGASKLLVETWASELSRRAGARVQVATVCPGAVRTDIAREAPRWSRPLLAVAMRLFFKPPADAAAPIVWLAAARAIEGETGVYLHVGRRKPRAPHADDPVTGRGLWEKCERLLASAGHPLRPLDAAEGDA
jgi:NAD(P)-dependent dehydrogenase (short-subunit alcohol dehydrogenase family)